MRISLLFFVILACHRPENPMLAQKLVNDTYGMLFEYPQHELTLTRIWSEPGNAIELEALIDDTNAPAKARFIAAEVLFLYEPAFVKRHGAQKVARIYAVALQRSLIDHLNPWGLLWYNDSVGEVGSVLVRLGEASIPALIDLLDDYTILQGYWGSEEATLGNAARFRVRDFSAYYLSRIIERPLDIQPGDSFTVRDAKIKAVIVNHLLPNL